MKWAALLGLLAATPALADDPAGMARTAEGFLTAYGSFHPSDGIPDAAGRARYAPFISPRLEKSLADGDAAEKRAAARIKDAPPLIEGDLFTSLFEGASSWKLGACSGDAQKGRCAVNYTHADRGQAPVRWTDTLLLVNTPGGWRIDDIAYDAGFAFGNSGRLSQTLTMVQSEGR